MGNRPADWHPLTEDGRDPVPGDWEMVKEAAARYRRTADSIERARTLLSNTTQTSDGWEGRAGDAFREKATELSDNIFKAHGRYDATANALAGYWPALQDAQEESLELRTRAQNAQTDISSHQGQIDGIDTDTGTDEDQEDSQRRLDQAQERLGEAQDMLNAARARLAEVVAAKDNAAQAAANAIGDFIDDDGLEDGWKDRLGTVLDVLKNVLITIGEWAARVAAIAGVLALLVGWIPIIGQALAGILGAIALIASVFSLVGNILKGDWLGALIDIVGIATFGIGRAAGGLLKAAGQSTRFQAFRSLRGMSQFGNRAARTARAEGIVGNTAGRLHGLSVEARAFTKPSGLLGWGREAFGGGLDFAKNFRALRDAPWSRVLPDTGSMFRNIPQNFRTAGPGGALQAGAHQFFGAPGAAADALSLGRAAQNGASFSGFAGASAAQWGSGGAGAVSGMGGLIFKDGVDSIWNWPSLSVGGDNPLPGDAVAAGDFSYQESEAMPVPAR
ncbi:putative T7SS-secreted protein [Streptomyces sp. NBC_01803]|uniref:putative T7SS-secreted protein n=1 Tax=Streptomyces sp. NBC_01803 TaxID=2975946 RepID=UPI002DD8C747|nr:hypothetical protein [Streptomyces sp. NBC_01803]WSA45615.1 hypothetical protein OIE51_16245 [Streptomyces sp. NBC_01803]